VDPAAADAVPAAAAAGTPVAAAAVRLSPHAWAPEGTTTLDVVERLGRIGGPGLVLLRPPGAAVAWVGAGAVQEAMRTALRGRDGRGRS
jgi:hypothetical protein